MVHVSFLRQPVPWICRASAAEIAQQVIAEVTRHVGGSPTVGPGFSYPSLSSGLGGSTLNPNTVTGYPGQAIPYQPGSLPTYGQPGRPSTDQPPPYSGRPPPPAYGQPPQYGAATGTGAVAVAMGGEAKTGRQAREVGRWGHGGMAVHAFMCVCRREWRREAGGGEEGAAAHPAAARALVVPRDRQPAHRGAQPAAHRRGGIQLPAHEARAGQGTWERRAGGRRGGQGRSNRVGWDEREGEDVMSGGGMA